MRYAWIKEHRDSWPLSRMCSALRVSRSSYYNWNTRIPSPRDQGHERIEKLVLESHSSSHGIYGYRKIHRDMMNNDMENCCAETVRRAMKRLGIKSRRARKYVANHRFQSQYACSRESAGARLFILCTQ